MIQVSSNDPLTQKIALNNAVNLQKHYGMDNIAIEIVAMQDITFSACANTMKKITKKKGKKPVLLEGVGIVPAGVARIIELQEQGYSYVRP